MNREFIPLNHTQLCMTKSSLKLDLQHEGYTNISYSGKLRGFFASK